MKAQPRIFYVGPDDVPRLFGIVPKDEIALHVGFYWQRLRPDQEANGDAEGPFNTPQEAEKDALS